LASLFAQNSLSNAQNNLAQSVQRLSSGLRINSAKDDAAGLTIAQNMQSQINGVNQSIRNLSDATNLIQTAESSLATIQDMLLRMKQLSTQGYNGSLSTTQKNALVNELTDLNSEINATAVRTKFNGVDLLATGQSIDSNTGDVFKGQYLTAVGVSISSTGDLDQTGKYSLSSSPPAISATGSSTYTIETDNDVFKRNMVGTYTFSSYDDTLTLTYQDADTGKISQQSLRVNDALHDPVVAKTTEQELDFSDFGIKLNLSNTVAAGAEDSLGANIAAVFDTKTIIYTGQSSQITDVSLSGTQSAT
jgi:flagellin